MSFGGRAISIIFVGVEKFENQTKSDNADCPNSSGQNRARSRLERCFGSCYRVSKLNIYIKYFLYIFNCENLL